MTFRGLPGTLLAALLAACAGQPAPPPAFPKTTEVEVTIRPRPAAASSAPEAPAESAVSPETEAPSAEPEAPAETAVPVAPPAAPLPAEPVAPADRSGQRVSAASETREPRAREHLRRLADRGLPAEIEVVEIDGRTWYRVVLSGVLAPADARRMVQRLRRLGYPSAWILQPP